VYKLVGRYVPSHKCFSHQRTRRLLNLGVEDSLGEDLLGDLGTHIGISRLGSNEDSSNFTLLSIDLVHFHFDSSVSNFEGLVVLLEELSITLLSGLKTRKGNSHIVSGNSSTSLGVKEKTGTVGRNRKVSSHLEAGLEGSSVSSGNKLLNGEEEWNTLSSWKLDSGGCVVNTLLLRENNLASVGLQASLNSLKSVGLTGHDLRVDELLLSLSSLSNLLLNSPGLGLNAHIDKTGSRLGSDGVLSDDLRATVGKTSSLNLEVGKLVELGFGDGLGGGGGDSEDGGRGESGGSNLGNVVLHGVELGGALLYDTGTTFAKEREIVSCCVFVNRIGIVVFLSLRPSVDTNAIEIHHLSHSIPPTHILTLTTTRRSYDSSNTVLSTYTVGLGGGERRNAGDEGEGGNELHGDGVSG
jgi:hypothetical protein